MNTEQQTLLTAQTRRATKDETDHAAMVLRSLGNESLASRLESEYGVDQGEDYDVAVVTDFSSLPESTNVLLVPPGTYTVPVEVLSQVRLIIGLAWERADYPVLILQGEPRPMTNSDTLEESFVTLGTATASIAGVILDAPSPTILETALPGADQFSDKFFNVTFSPNVDALNVYSQTLFNGWGWVINAYGISTVRERHVVEKGLDAVHEEGVMNGIDSIFRPLVRWGERIDRVMGWK